MEKAKKILDSVHGYITIPEDICDNVIDTPYFQRLRRVEQTSCRVLFPSARHDRFIHSLGVYHLGKKIVNAIRQNCDKDLPDTFEDRAKNYLMACLLHDVSHTPFSHTFEDYYMNSSYSLKDLLSQTINKPGFSSDWNDREWKSAPHEIMSAIMAITCFPNYVKKPEYDLEFIARMIVGCKYSDQTNSFENAFIELLHSNILDADGLDYACRDAVMAGYSTNNIDVDRLVGEIFIVKDMDDNGLYKVCFSNKAINEIESVLGVKHFQQYNVFAHHVVSYDQKLLEEAMKSAAYWHLYGKMSFDALERKKALETLCNIKAFTEPYLFGSFNIPLLYPSDDDFVSLMKYFPDDYYIKQWLTRKYQLQALWKSKSEFKHYFGDTLGDISIEGVDLWVFSEECKKYLCDKFNIKEYDIWILEPKLKDRFGSTSELQIYIDGKIKKYEYLYPKGRMHFNDLGEQFKYIYIPMEIDKNTVLKSLKLEQEKHKEISMHS
jgi:HD superfamily phosphohydrolase